MHLHDIVWYSGLGKAQRIIFPGFKLISLFFHLKIILSVWRKTSTGFSRFVWRCYCRIPWTGLLTYNRDLFLSTLKVQTYDQSDNIWCPLIACLMVSRKLCLHMTERTREIFSILLIRVLITFIRSGPFSMSPPLFSHLYLQHDFWWKVRIQFITYWVFMYG